MQNFSFSGWMRTKSNQIKSNQIKWTIRLVKYYQTTNGIYLVEKVDSKCRVDSEAYWVTKYVIYFSAIKVPCITYCTRKMNLIDDNDGDNQWCEVKCVIKIDENGKRFDSGLYWERKTWNAESLNDTLCVNSQGQHFVNRQVAHV